MDTNARLREVRAAQARHAKLAAEADLITDPGLSSDRDEAANAALMAAGLHALALVDALGDGAPLPDEWCTNRKVEILHDRDPDSSCTHEVFLDGAPIRAVIESTDPGAGQAQSDWEEELHALAADTTMSPAARNAALDSHSASFDSDYVEKNPADDCVKCESGQELPHAYLSRDSATEEGYGVDGADQ